MKNKLNNNGIAMFEKVTFEQFSKDCKACDILNEQCDIRMAYNSIELPTRSTKSSAGYDFKSPFKISFKPCTSIKFPTGIRCYMNEDYVLQLYPRSSLGFKYRLQLDNTVGIVDADYYYADNEGHIQCKMTNDSNTNFTINMGDGFMQGVFMKYGITKDDEANGKRKGGTGSTDIK